MRKIKFFSYILLLMIICSGIIVGTIEIATIEITNPLIDKYNQTFLPVVYVENYGINSGTGMIIYSQYGYNFVLTAYHVIQHSNTPVVATEYNNRSYPAVIIEEDEQNDLAVLKIDSYINIGRPVKFLEKNEKVMVYEPIYSVGHTLGRELMVTSGEIASLGRVWSNNGQRYITVNSPVYGGSSGGPTYIARKKWYDRLPTYYVIGMVSKGDSYRGYMVSHIVYMENHKTIINFLEQRGLNFVLDHKQTPQIYLEKKRLENEKEKKRQQAKIRQKE